MDKNEQILGLLTEMSALLSKVTVLVGTPADPADSGDPSVYPQPATFYGNNGYTDAYDPRQGNARQHALSAAGLVTGVDVKVHVKPATRYKCVNVRLVDENEAAGQHIIQVRTGNISRPLTIRLAYPYDGGADHFDHYIPAGNDKNEFVLVNAFNPPAVGPLAIVILDEQGYINSDVVAGLGLPLGHHVSFVIQFELSDRV